nr:putative cupin domain-containing protein [uncultured bacterium]
MNPLALGGMPLEVFLAEYWQKKPLLIRGGLKNLQSPLDADSLAGLACEEDVESRLVIQSGSHWRLEHGPFNDKTFSALPSSHWTLLVQAVDHWVPAAAQLLEQFNFIPSWRIDDLMMSYATDGGGVGPHYDNYDVFLVQACGQRTWEIGGRCDESSGTREKLPVKILTEFKAVQSWVLDPGDILYVPPGIAHNGMAKGDGCITCSVGFRAPSHAEMLSEFSDYLAEKLNESERYSDADLSAQSNTGEITPAALARAQKIFARYLANDKALGDWFGRYVTATKYGHIKAEVDSPPESMADVVGLAEHLAAGGTVVRSEGSRFAYIGEGERHALFVDGERVATSVGVSDLVELLCSNIKFDNKLVEATEANLKLLAQLLSDGSLYMDGGNGV